MWACCSREQRQLLNTGHYALVRFTDDTSRQLLLPNPSALGSRAAELVSHVAGVKHTPHVGARGHDGQETFDGEGGPKATLSEEAGVKLEEELDASRLRYATLRKVGGGREADGRGERWGGVGWGVRTEARWRVGRVEHGEAA